MNYLTWVELASSVPDGETVVVQDYLNLDNESQLEHLPEKLKVWRWFSCRNCTSLISAPRVLETDGEIRFDGCSSLRTPPERITMSYFEEREPGVVSFQNCPKLQRLPRQMDIYARLKLNGSRIVAIPRQVQVADQTLEMDEDQIVLVPSRNWKAKDDIGDIVDGSLLSVDEFDLLLEKPSLCRFAITNALFRQQLEVGELDVDFLQRAYAARQIQSSARLM